MTLRFESRAAQTIVELLVATAVVGVLVAVLLPAVQSAREASRATLCRAKLRQIGLALQLHHDVRRSFPAGVSSSITTNPFPFMAWPTRLLPYIEQGDLWNESIDAYSRQRIPFFTPEHYMAQLPLDMFACPSDSRVSRTQLTRGHATALTSYVGVWGLDIDNPSGVLFQDSEIRLSDICDGTSTTIAVGERPPSSDMWYGWWYAGDGLQSRGDGDMLLGVRERNYGDPDTASCPEGPYRYREGDFYNQCDLFHFWSPHPGGAHFLFADGAVRLIPYDADEVLPALASRAGAEPISGN